MQISTWVSTRSSSRWEDRAQVRVVTPASKLSTLTWWADTTLGAEHDAATVSTGVPLEVRLPG